MWIFGTITALIVTAAVVAYLLFLWLGYKSPGATLVLTDPAGARDAAYRAWRTAFYVEAIAERWGITLDIQEGPDGGGVIVFSHDGRVCRRPFRE